MLGFLKHFIKKSKSDFPPPKPVSPLESSWGSLDGLMDHADKIVKEVDFGYNSNLDLAPSSPHSQTYVIIDTETTGVCYSKDRVVQIAAIRYDSNGLPADTYCTYVDPGITVSPEAVAINHITSDMLKGAPTPQQVAADLLQFLGDDLLVGYNVGFDLRMLERTFPGHFFGRQYVDAYPLTGGMIGLPDRKLSTVAAALGFVPKAGFHDALGDCEAVAVILKELDADLGACVKVFHPAPPAKKFPEKTAPLRPHFITAEELAAPTHHPFFMKKIVFTGELSIDRHTAEQMVVDVGASVKTAVSRKTDYLIVGQQDLKLVGADGLSRKQETAIALNEAGEAHITILDEAGFLALMESGEEALPHG